MITAFVQKILEDLNPLVFQHHSLTVATEHMPGEISRPRFLAIQIWLLFVYTTMRELVRCIGRPEVLEMFFGLRRKASGLKEPGQ